MIELDCNLITALVERWRPAAHPFHLIVGKTVVTLHDVSVITGLPVEGLSVTGNVRYDWTDVCERLFRSNSSTKMHLKVLNLN